jgi:hypothetical protein
MSDVAAPSWPVLKQLEARVLGVLVEKAKTTPDAYPMSMNGLVVGCNQKSNRDPVMNVDEVDVDQTLEELQRKGLVIRVTGGRVDRWRQALYEVWTVSKAELAVLAELLLRGAQTEGELRARAARMEPIADLDELRAILRPLVERKLVHYVTPERSRGAMVTHGFVDPDELARMGGRQAMSEPPATRASAAPPPSADWKPDVEQLRGEVERLRTELSSVRDTLELLRRSLGANESVRSE